MQVLTRKASRCLGLERFERYAAIAVAHSVYVSYIQYVRETMNEVHWRDISRVIHRYVRTVRTSGIEVCQTASDRKINGSVE